jgi:hypothetical protein
MNDRQNPADKARASFHEKIERRAKALLAEHGISRPSGVPLTVAVEVLQRIMVETAAANFPTANLALVGHGLKSFSHTAFVPAWSQVRSSTAISDDAFAMAEGVDAAVLLAGFGLPVAPFDLTMGILEKPSNDIDRVVAMFSRWPTALVGYNSCDVPFYVLLTNCVRSLRNQVFAHPGLFDVRRLFARSGGSLPPDPGADFIHGMTLFARQPGDTVSTVLLFDPSTGVGLMVFHAGWRVAGQAYGAPFDGYAPFPVQLLRAIACEPVVAYLLSSAVSGTTTVH